MKRTKKTFAEIRIRQEIREKKIEKRNEIKRMFNRKNY